jgi:REP element-mobilizing transposase RayT
MHLVLRSSKAVEDMSFKAPHNRGAIEKIISRFSAKYGVRIISLANVGTHLHFHVKIAKRRGYLCFIRAVTAAIAMHVSGKNRWTLKKLVEPARTGVRRRERQHRDKFWDYRPFTRIVDGFRAFLNLRDYIQINQLEGLGVPRHQARFLLASVRPNQC